MFIWFGNFLNETGFGKMWCLITVNQEANMVVNLSHIYVFFLPIRCFFSQLCKTRWLDKLIMRVNLSFGLLQSVSWCQDAPGKQWYFKAFDCLCIWVSFTLIEPLTSWCPQLTFYTTDLPNQNVKKKEKKELRIKILLSFNKDAFRWSKVTVKTFTL